MSIELPPLRRFVSDFHVMRKHDEGPWCFYDEVEARERILREALDFQAALVKELLPYQEEAVRLRARIAELEAEVHAHTEAIKVFEAANAEVELDRNLWIELSKQRKRGFEDLQKRVPPREATEHMVTQGMLAQISNFDQSARYQVSEIWRVMYIASENKG